MERPAYRVRAGASKPFDQTSGTVKRALRSRLHRAFPWARL